MKYFYDTEFIEGSQSKRFMGIKYGETKPTIDLISIGIVSEDGRKYYAISKDFNLKEAWDRKWIRENVLNTIYNELTLHHLTTWGIPSNPHFRSPISDTRRLEFNLKSLKFLIRTYGKSNKQIAKELKQFIGHRENEYNTEQWILDLESKGTELYGWYSAYDHVAFCWIFGKMILLPAGYPKYTKDLKQMLDALPKNEREQFVLLPDYRDKILSHNALSDAQWNKKVYELITNIKNERETK